MVVHVVQVLGHIIFSQEGHIFCHEVFFRMYLLGFVGVQ